MSTLRISNIEAKSVPASATTDEKIKITNSSGDVLVFLDGKTSGITTVGINTTDGNLKFDANSNIVVSGIVTATAFYGDGSNLTGIAADKIFEGNTEVETVDTGSNGHIKFTTEGSERLRIDSSGRLLLGLTSDSRTTSMVISGNTSGATSFGMLNLDLGTTSVSADTNIGIIRFGATGDRRGADIRALGEGTWSAGSSHPTRLSFYTNAAGSAGTPTERLRIQSDGTLVTGAQTIPTSSDIGNIYIKNASAIGSQGHQINYVSNAVFNGAWKYINSGTGATQLVVNQNGYQFGVAGSGTAGNNITFNPALNISSAGAS